MTANQNTIKRKMYFHKVTCNTDEGKIGLDTILKKYVELYDYNAINIINQKLTVKNNDKIYFLEMEPFSGGEIYKGRLQSLRKENFPLLFNMSEGISKEISHDEDDALIEQTHFICIPSKRLIVSEYNHYGAKIEYLGTYLKKIMNDHCMYDCEISISPIIIPDFFEEMVKCSSIKKLQIKASHPGLKHLKDHGIINAYDILSDEINDESGLYFNLEVSAERGKYLKFSNIKKYISGIIGMGRDLKRDDLKNIKKVKVVAYDDDLKKNIVYDLLNEKLMQECTVIKSSRSRYLDSHMMYEKLTDAYREKISNALRYIGSYDE